MPTAIPRCANAVDGTCKNSNVKLMNENDESWIFQCQTCKCLQVVSKDGIRDKSNFEAAHRRRQEEIERQKRWDSRRKYF